MTKMRTNLFPLADLEPPPRIYARMARSSLMRRVYQGFVTDLAASLPARASLLDIGTGPGYLLDYLARERPDLNLVGMDLSFQMLRQGRLHPMNPVSPAPIQQVVAAAGALPFASGQFHHALVTFSFHHWAEPAQGLAEISRVLKARGRAWIYELNREAALADLRRYARQEKLPFFFVHLGFVAVSRHHALGATDFISLMAEAGISSWQLHPAHHIYWRLEISK